MRSTGNILLIESHESINIHDFIKTDFFICKFINEIFVATIDTGGQSRVTLTDS